MLQRVRLAVQQGCEAAFEAALCEVRQRVFMSAGFRGFTVLQGVEEPSTYEVQIQWETVEELLADAESGRSERCWAPVEQYLVGSLVVEHLVERPSLGLHGPGVITDLAWLHE